MRSKEYVALRDFKCSRCGGDIKQGDKYYWVKKNGGVFVLERIGLKCYKEENNVRTN